MSIGVSGGLGSVGWAKERERHARHCAWGVPGAFLCPL
jgi:hypothetical protein